MTHHDSSVRQASSPTAPRRALHLARAQASGLATFALAVVLACIAGGCASSRTTQATPTHTPGGSQMRLGNFSVSLAVSDIAASRAFYEKLGFTMVSGDQSKNWVVLQNGGTTIGLFQGMFPKNTLTFNPGWDSNKATLPHFEDVRDLQKTLKARGLTPNPAADESTSGPAYFMLIDPDGNPILFDQHVPSPTNLKK